MIARRLARSHLLQPAPRTRLVDVVRDVCLIQAQILSAAEHGLCVRVRGATRAHVQRALYHERSLVKTWSIRSTLHLVPADELGLWSAATRRDDVDERILTALDGRALTRGELADELDDDRLRSGWGECLQPLARSGLICFGEGLTFVRVDQWLGHAAGEVDPGDARREILRRWLRTYGPARSDDFRRWSGFERAEVKVLWADADLEEVRVEGTRAWLLAGDGEFSCDGASIVLLPRYDAYVLGFRPREPLLPAPVKQRIAADGKGRYESVTGMSPLTVDGVVHGFWRREGDEIDVEEVIPVPRGRRQELAAAIERVRSASASSRT